MRDRHSRRRYGLNGRAAFALNNLCYLVGRRRATVRLRSKACERALALDPTMTTARTNLALAYALQGDLLECGAAALERLERRQQGNTTSEFYACHWASTRMLPTHSSSR